MISPLKAYLTLGGINFVLFVALFAPGLTMLLGSLAEEDETLAKAGTTKSYRNRRFRQDTGIITERVVGIILLVASGIFLLLTLISVVIATQYWQPNRSRARASDRTEPDQDVQMLDASQRDDTFETVQQQQPSASSAPTPAQIQVVADTSQ